MAGGRVVLLVTSAGALLAVREKVPHQFWGLADCTPR